METCSWCLDEVSDKRLRMIEDGARLCPDCLREARSQGRKVID